MAKLPKWWVNQTLNNVDKLLEQIEQENEEEEKK